MVDTFFRLTCSVALWGGRDSANNTGVCSQSLSHTGPAPAHGAHRSGSRLLRQEPSEAGRELHAPPMCKLLRLRHSGSPQWCRLGWACVLCPSQVRVARVFGERGRCDSAVPAAQFSGCTTGAPSQADGDRPEPQEVSVSKEACLQFGSLCLSGATMAHFRPSGSGCLSPEGDGLQPANSVPSFVLCVVLAVSYVRAFRW